MFEQDWRTKLIGRLKIGTILAVGFFIAMQLQAWIIANYGG